MISIIISSRDSDQLERVSRDIDKKIGVQYEVITIPNASGELGICEAYNLGAKRSKYDILCFMHEDIMFHTQDWGAIVLNVLQDQTIGLVGVAGGALKTKAPTGWWCEGYPSGRINLLQHHKDGRVVRYNSKKKTQSLVDVVTIDGVWFCCPKAVWEKSPFDAETFSDFHLYDFDFAMQVLTQNRRVCVTYEVLIEHFSDGSYGEVWATNAIKFIEKWRHTLPRTVLQLPASQLQRIEWKDFQYFTKLLLTIGYDPEIIAQYVRACFTLKPFAPSNWYLFARLLRQKYL
jgi:hypothetical protein